MKLSLAQSNSVFALNMRQHWGTRPEAGVERSQCVITVHMAGLSTRDQLHAAVLLQPLKHSKQAASTRATSNWT